MEANSFKIRPPEKIFELGKTLLAELKGANIPASEVTALEQSLDKFMRDWKNTYVRFGDSDRGELSYRDLLIGFQEEIVAKVDKKLPESSAGRKAIAEISAMFPIPKTPKSKPINLRLLARLKLGVKTQLHWNARYRTTQHFTENSQQDLLLEDKGILEFFRSPTTPEEVWQKLSLLPSSLDTEKPKPQNSEEFARVLQKAIALKQLEEALSLPEFERPIFIVSAPRAGSTLLFETLSQFPNLWGLGTESHDIIEAIPELHPATRNYSSNRLTADNASPDIGEKLREGFTRQLRDRSQSAYLNVPPGQRPETIRFLEKTPRNALRVSFLKAVFPDALFIFLYREPKGNISSIMEGWRSRRFMAYPSLPNWPHRDWNFLLIPEWQSLKESSLAEIAAHQWKAANTYILEDLKAIPASDWCSLNYRDLIGDPKESITKIGKFTKLSWDEKIEGIVSQSLPVSRMSFSQPSPDKWRKNEREILKVLPIVEPIVNLIESQNLC
ncbi:MAG: sulfotransferase [Cyanobacteria bacterium SBLK]|nr:sulfotransferase [Cyanobacteria bacterium SBLK]